MRLEIGHALKAKGSSKPRHVSRHVRSIQRR
jgi:hypothetical protein